MRICMRKKRFFNMLNYLGCLALSLMLTACFGMGRDPQPEEQENAAYYDDILDLDADLAIDAEMNSAWDDPGALVDNAASSPEVCEGECLTDRMEIGDVSVNVSREDDPGLDLALSHEPRRTAKASSGARRMTPRQRMRATATPTGPIPRPAHEKAALCDGSKVVCISSPFGVARPGHMHKGVDISAPHGSPIKAFRNGVVVDARRHHSYGNVVGIRQSDGLISRYAHMSQILVKEGDKVWQGQVIGRVGSTGRSTGPHLHFELIRGNMAMNPMLMLASPGHVVTAGTASDAEQARRALAASGSSSGSSRAHFGRSRSVVDRHAPVRRRHSGNALGKLQKVKQPAMSGRNARRAAEQDRKLAAAKGKGKNAADLKKKGGVERADAGKKAGKGKKLLAAADRKAQARAEKKQAAKAEPRAQKKGASASSRADASRKSGGKKAVASAAKGGKKKKS